ncbi:FAD-dependent oxidoreductase [Lentzea aerocolonigenes]|uniref:FAD-dependent oxidoreductase n=1 Tax=Lentzea aerocolonigenes TaxID=68170 RepID=UPI0004C375E3|nr:NAD(P)/FAD-dependent oxidoreductase [Lentzea aerocolonigenes]MCP2248513.1 2-polyprenyl-6-methoxyphenol hydroxylase [Lentzea aerocolonigenes]
MDYDVIIVGASIAGCTAATAYGRAGLRVALLERHHNPQAHKTLCGHFILGGTHDVLQRLGFWQQMLDHGAAVTQRLGVWTDAGWIVRRPGDGVPPAISLRRSKLDPLLRDIAAATPGVDLLMGQKVVDLVEGGVVTNTGTTLRARLVVGADGHRSTVAQLAGVPEDHAPNERFLFWAYYEGARMNGPGDGQVWQLDPDVAVCVPAGDGLTLVGAFPAKQRLAEFADDRLAAFDRFVARLPGGPSLAGARRASNLVGTTDYPCVRRDPAPRPGVALIGDAATTSDPVPAVGCGWAFRSAAWLAEATAGPLRDGTDLGPALRRYRRAHRFIGRYDDIGRRDALAKPPNALQRTIRSAAVTDPWIARRLAAFGSRSAAPSVLLNPVVVARALLTRATCARTGGG